MFKKLQIKHSGFTLVEIMIVVAIIALLAAIAVPGFLRARKRSQASKILNDLRMIDGAVDQYAIETGRKTGDTVGIADWSLGRSPPSPTITTWTLPAAASDVSRAAWVSQLELGNYRLTEGTVAVVERAFAELQR